MPAPAFAHGIGGEAADRSILGFIPLGIEHMLLGWDHLLFIGGVVLLTREWRRAAKMITIFVLGHSTTLIVATMAGWQVNAGFVDVIIALSVVFVGAVGLFIGQPKWNVFGYVVLAFGLIHGLGLSTRLQDLGLPEEGVLWRVIAFNVGIEIGQLTAIVAMVAIAAVLSMVLGRDRGPVLRKFASAGLFIGGAVAASLVAFQAFTVTGEDNTEVAVDETAGCSVADRTESFQGMGGHTAKNFYEPNETTPMGDFGHSLGDGYVVVLYPPSLEEPALDELRSFVTGPDGQGVLAGPSADPVEEVKAVNAYETLTCDDLDVETLQEFTTEWFDSLQG
jgi:hydrogenase/urease accessory protein HupE